MIAGRGAKRTPSTCLKPASAWVSFEYTLVGATMRRSTVTTAGKWAAPISGAGTVTNNAAINFAAFSGTVSAGADFTHFGLFDALTGGNALYYGDLTDQTKDGGTGDTITFVPASLVLTEG